MPKQDDPSRRTQASGLETSPQITRLTAEDAERLARTESRTDWARLGAMTSEEIEAQAAADEAEDGMVVDWSSVTSNRPPRRR